MIATECGLIHELDRNLLRKACEYAQPWLASGKLKFLSFNTSALEIVRPGYAEEILALARRAGVPPEKLCIELVESAIIHDLERASANLFKLRDHGVRIALDDYGTGYSNLRALLDLPIDRIKVDRSLIGEVDRDERAMKLVLSLVQLAHTFNAELVAEGVEDDGQAAFLEAMSFRYLQGFRFGVPANGEDFDQLLNLQEHCAA